MKDDLLVIQAATTDAADDASAAFNLKAAGGSGMLHQGPLWVHIIYTNAVMASSTGTVQFNLDHNADGGVTWKDNYNGEAEAIAVSTTAVAGELWLPVVTDLDYIRVAVDVPASNFTGITWQAHLVTSRP